MALASTANYELITGVSLEGAALTRVEGLLELTESAVLAGAHGQNITETTYTDQVLHPYEGVVILPQRPVSDVAAVSLVYSDGTERVLGASDYRFEPGGNGRPARLIRRMSGSDWVWGSPYTPQGMQPTEVAVKATYTAGWSPIPGQVIAIQVGMVKAMVDNAGGPAPISDQLGAAAFTYDHTEVQSGSLALKPSAQATLDRLFKVSGPTSVAIERSQP